MAEREAEREELAREPQTALRERLLGFAAATVIRAVRAGNRLTHHGDQWLRERERRRERTIYAFWHRHLFLMPYCYRGDRIHMLSSHHRDAEIIVQAMRRFGVSAIRGSSTRGGAAGLKGLLREAAAGSDLAFTPDGPKGPPEEVKLGVIQAAALGGLPIQPIAIAASRRWILRKTWDQFEIPKPFGRVAFVYGEPLLVERRGDAEAAARELTCRLNDAAARAEQRVGRGEPTTSAGDET